MNKLLSWSLIIGGIPALFGCEEPPISQSSRDLLDPVPTTPPLPLPSPTASPKPNFIVTVTLASPQDLKIKTGDLVKSGQVLGQNSAASQQLTQIKQQLEAKLQQQIIPILAPNLNLQEQQNALAQAKLKAVQSEQEYQKLQQELRFNDPSLLEALESEKLQKMQTLKQEKQLADQQIINLTRQIQASEEQYLLDLANYQKLEQRRQQEVQVLLSQIQSVKQQLQKLPITSPIAGKVGKIDYVEQKDQALTAKIILEPIDSPTDSLPPLNLPDLSTVPKPPQNSHQSRQ